MRIFLAENGQKTGPFHPWEVRGRLERGEVTEKILGWHEGCENWMPLKDLPALGLQERSEEPVPPPLPEDFTNRDGAPASGENRNVLYPDGEPPRPWSRFLARSMDLMIWFTICVAFLRIIGQPIVPFLLNPVQLLIAYSLMALPESICLSVFGTTPGKILLGLRVVNKGGGGFPAPAVAWQRSLLVLVIGNACYYSLAAMVAWLFHYVGLMRNSSTWWDRKLGLQVRGEPIRPIQIIRFVLFFFALNLLFSAVMGRENLEEWMRIIQQAPGR
ncbi:MAG: RDD family protein [Verrucomicrobiales bacterium]